MPLRFLNENPNILGEKNAFTLNDSIPQDIQCRQMTRNPNGKEVLYQHVCQQSQF